jgi:hypothetical protein
MTEVIINNIPDDYFNIFSTDIYTRRSRIVPNWLETKTDDHSKSQTEFTKGESDEESNESP